MQIFFQKTIDKSFLLWYNIGTEEGRTLPEQKKEVTKMTKCINCGSTAQLRVTHISAEENRARTKLVAQTHRYKCGCGCEFEVYNNIETKVTKVTLFTELDKDRRYEVVLGTTVSSRMNEQEAIRMVNKMRSFFPDKNIYYRLARI